MAKIRKLYDETIKPDGNKTTIYPITSTRAVYTPNSITVDHLLSEGYRFGGVVIPSSVPPITDQRVFYGANTPGVYTSFGGITVDSGEAVFIIYDGTTWSKKEFGGTGLGTLTGYKALSSTIQLPTEETQYGYLIGENLYVWVGQGGDTLGGLYKNCGKLRGESAYETAVAYGFEGTVSEWLNSLKGQRGYTGLTGQTGPAGVTSADATIDSTTGNPQVTVNLENGNLSLAFSGIKGEQGNSGYTGAAEELEVVNNLTQGGAEKALSAEMGKSINDDLYPPAHEEEDAEFPDTAGFTETYVTYGGYPGDSGGYHGGAHPLPDKGPETAVDCSTYYPIKDIAKITYSLCSRNTNTAVISYWTAGLQPVYVGTINVDRHIAGLQGTNRTQEGTVWPTDFPRGAAYIQFCSTRTSRIVPGGNQDLAFDFERSVHIIYKRGEKYTQRTDFDVLNASANGTDYTPLIGNANPNNSGNATDIRTDSDIPVSKGDVVTVTFNRPLEDGQYYRYIFTGSDILGLHTGIGVHRTERTIDAGTISNRYVITSDATVGICIGIRLIGANGTIIPLRPASQYIVGDIVVNVQKASSVGGRIGNVETPNAYIRNKDKAVALGAACRQRKSSNYSKDLQFLIITDSHADDTAVLNGVTMANGFDTIDAIIHLGDMTGNAMTCNETLPTFTSAEGCSTKPFYNVIGNHEAGTYNMVGAVPSQEHMYNVLIAPMVDKGYLEYGEYTEGKCYYYHDFHDNKIRLIVLNEFDGTLELDTTYWTPVTYDSSRPSIAYNTTYQPGDIVKIKTSDLYYDEYCFECVQTAKTGPSLSSPGLQSPRYIYDPKNRFISEEQAQWFLNTLFLTPTGYSVVVAMHQVFSPNTTTQVDKKFCQNYPAAGINAASNLMNTDFIADAVEAFINGTNFNEVVYYTVNGVIYSYTVAKNFTQKGSGTKFLCYLGGHSHKDLIWKHNTYNRQWMVAPVCSNAEGYHQCPPADIRRANVDGIDYDSLTAIAFNTDDRAVSLTKLGVNVTEEMTLRDVEKIKLI